MQIYGIFVLAAYNFAGSYTWDPDRLSTPRSELKFAALLLHHAAPCVEVE